ncbi:MAG TPA: TIGR04211 family SH3 domain-containing protein [Deltaproteobacteria bacterium]|nr:TIGR04211 family SH3 domain-containing protein [Deltaproteobacteria bacterium]
MKQIVVCSLVMSLVILLVQACPLHARGMYVRDWITITLRTAPSEGARDIGLANTNDFLEILQEQGEWYRVKTPGGIEGWVQARFLTNQTPKALIIEQLNDKVQSLTEANRALEEENKQLQKDNRERNFKLSSIAKEMEKSKQDYETLKEASSDYLDLKQNYEKLLADAQDRDEQLAVLSRENNRLKTSERLGFMLIGGGFIIAGMIIGFFLQAVRSKPKKTGYKF